MTTDNYLLDDLFDRAKQVPEPSADLVARVLADADAVQKAAIPEAAPVTAPPSRGRRQGSVRAGFADALGGWLGLSGLAAASIAGLVIGVALPDTIDSVTDGTLSSILGTSSLGGVTGIDAVGWVDDFGALE